MLAIAVIVANRNNARFLPQCLESIFRQTLPPAEVVVVDDASTDNSRELLIPYVREKRIKLLLNEEPLGVAASRHLAIGLSTSPYLSTLDSDDYYYGNDKLAAEALAVGGAATGRIGFSDVVRVTEADEAIGLVSRHRRIREGDLSFRIPHLSGFIPRDYLVSRRDYYEAGGFNPGLRLYEDWELKIRLSRRCTWHYSGAVGTAYRDNPRGLSKAPRKEHLAAMRKIFLMHCAAKHPVSRAFAFARFFVYHSLYLRRPAI